MVEKSDSPERADDTSTPHYNDYSLEEPYIDYGLAEEYNEPDIVYEEKLTSEERAAMDAWEEKNPYDRSNMRIKKWQQNWHATLDELRLQRAREQVEEAAKSHADDTES